jgi:hypothetical protein
VSDSATSPDFTTGALGTYRWIALYNGDPNNAPVVSGCDDETVSVGQATPSIATMNSGGGPVGAAISDTATVTGGFNPTGTVTFQLYAPGDGSCATPVATFGPIPLTGSPGSAASGAFTTTAVGTYRWVATYSGDDNNVTNDSGCQNELVTITEAPSQTQPPSTTSPPSVPGLPDTGYGGRTVRAARFQT